VREAQAKGLVSGEGIAQETVRIAQEHENRRKRWEKPHDGQSDSEPSED
jgi:hypothetical protein